MADSTTTVAAALEAAGTELLFGLPGGGPNLDLIGAAAERGIRFVLTHGETAAAIMASTYGLLRGAPAAVVVTRGPGTSSAINGAAQATLDRYPVVLVTDTVPAAESARVPHQRLPQRRLLAPVTKAGLTVSDATAVDEVAAAIALAMTHPRGAVHLDVDPTAAPGAGGLGPAGGGSPGRSVADAVDDPGAARRLLDGASHPVVIVGMGGLDRAAELRGTLERLGAPVLTTYQAIGCVPTEGDLHAGLFTNGAVERPVLDAADLIVAIGLDVVEPIPRPWTVTAPVLSLTPSATVDPYLPIAVELIGDPAALAADLLAGRRTAWTAGAGARFRTEARAALRPPAPDAARFGPLELVDGAARLAPPAATVTVDAGAHFLAAMPMWPVREARQLLISNGLATMGFSVPAAIGAALARPDRPVVCLTGDGGLAMTVAELETIARLDVPITVIVFDDAALSLIEIKQGPAHGGRDAVRYRPVDLAAQARAAGLDAAVVRSAAELAAVLPGGWDRPRLIDARIDPADYRHLIAVTRGG